MSLKFGTSSLSARLAGDDGLRHQDAMAVAPDDVSDRYCATLEAAVVGQSSAAFTDANHRLGHVRYPEADVNTTMLIFTVPPELKNVMMTLRMEPYRLKLVKDTAPIQGARLIFSSGSLGSAMGHGPLSCNGQLERGGHCIVLQLGEAGSRSDSERLSRSHALEDGRPNPAYGLTQPLTVELVARGGGHFPTPAISCSMSQETQDTTAARWSPPSTPRPAPSSTFDFLGVTFDVDDGSNNAWHPPSIALDPLHPLNPRGQSGASPLDATESVFSGAALLGIALSLAICAMAALVCARRASRRLSYRGRRRSPAGQNGDRLTHPPLIEQRQQQHDCAWQAQESLQEESEPSACMLPEHTPSNGSGPTWAPPPSDVLDALRHGLAASPTHSSDGDGHSYLDHNHTADADGGHLAALLSGLRSGASSPQLSIIQEERSECGWSTVIGSSKPL